MSLDREELVARLAVADFANPQLPNASEGRGPVDWADFIVECADALIARLRPAPVAQVADTPEPRRTVGAVVRWNNDSREYVIVSPDGCRAVHNDMGAALFTLRDTDTFVRWATREECEKHGIPYVEHGAAPSPAAAPDHPTAASFAARRGQGAEGDQHPAAYVPKVGDRVMHAGPDDGRRFVVTAVDAFAVIRVDSRRSAFCVSGPWIDNAAPVYLGPATAAERAAAGLPPITPDHPQGGQGAEAEGRVGDQRVAAGLDAPAKPAPAVDREAFTTLLDAVKWVLNDAAFKAPEQMGEVAERWVARLERAIDSLPPSLTKGGAS